MSRHDTDLTSLIAGLVFMALGVTYLLDAMDVVDVEVKWAVPLTLIGLGLAGLAGTLLRAHQERPPGRDEAAAAPADDPDGERAAGRSDDERSQPETPAV